MNQHALEVSQGKRFEFGKNWRRFLTVLDNERIFEAENSLKLMLGMESLNGKTFLDIGSGSGLFSLAARRLGANVVSFDYDPDSVACTVELKKRYFDNDAKWEIAQGSVLDENYVTSLGQFDIVYSWGVLHHTGDMWKALHNAKLAVKEGGLLFIAIYNDQGPISTFWKTVKRTYCSGPIKKFLVTVGLVPVFIIGGFFIDLAHKPNPFKRYTGYKSKRGMSFLRDWIDWFGGYPFEVAKPEEIFEFYQKYGFSLTRLKTKNGMGCNEFVFRKNS